jgi:hypothetical protein
MCDTPRSAWHGGHRAAPVAVVTQAAAAVTAARLAGGWGLLTTTLLLTDRGSLGRAAGERFSLGMYRPIGAVVRISLICV